MNNTNENISSTIKKTFEPLAKLYETTPKKLDDYSYDELKEELNKRDALEAKKIFDKRTAITRFIRDNKDVFLKLAKLMDSDKLTNDINKIDDYVFNCINLTFDIENGKEFFDKVFDGSKSIWSKYIEHNE